MMSILWVYFLTFELYFYRIAKETNVLNDTKNFAVNNETPWHVLGYSFLKIPKILIFFF